MGGGYETCMLTKWALFPHSVYMNLFEAFRKSPPETTLAALRDLIESQNDRIRALEQSRKELESLVSRRQDNRAQLLEHTAPAKLR